MKFKFIIVDDEPFARKLIASHASKIEGLEFYGECSNAIEASNLLRNKKVDLIFLDIQMPQLLGTNFIRILKSPPKVIFTTAFRKYAIEGFELDAVDYLLKPISFERFLKSINKVMQINFPVDHFSFPVKEDHKEPASSFLYFRVDRKMVKVFFNDILFIEALKDYIKIVTQTRTIVTKYVLATLAELLPADEFLRIHKSYIVAIGKIESFNADCIQIAKHELPIGRLYKYDVGRILNASSAT